MGRGRLAAQIGWMLSLTASGSSGCGLYDRSLLEPAPADSHAETELDALTRKPTLSYIAAKPTDAGTTSDGASRPPAVDMKKPKPLPEAGRASQDASAADSDAGMAPPRPAAPRLEMRGACGDRPGYERRETGHCYTPIAEPLSWYRARDLCNQRRSHLVTITQADEQAFVGSLPRNGPTWIGLSRFGTISYGWITGEATSFTAWAPDAPSNRSEGGALLREDTGAWFDASPGEAHPALCERDGRE